MAVCAIVADDLTGACDSAVHFAAAGLRTVVPLVADSCEGEAEVVAFSTESRDIAREDIPCRLRRVADRVRALDPRVIFKKIDSTLRGNTALEVIAAVEAFGCEAVVINPAFPAMGRVVRAGCLRVGADPAFQPIEIAAWLREHGAGVCRHVASGEIAAAIEEGARFVSLDAVVHDDLARIVEEVFGASKRILWAGSAGLAAELAMRVGGVGPSAVAQRCSGPVLFCIGSDHPVTIEQQRRLVARRGVEVLEARSTTARELSLALRRDVVLRVPRGVVDGVSLARVLRDCRPAALFLSGGDTASLVCQAIEAEAIELHREFGPGIPLGTLRGGAFDGITVVTKSGGFGGPDDLIEMANYFHA